MKTKSRREEISAKRYEKNIILILLGIAIILLIFFFYGIPLLINFSLFVLNLKGGNDMDNVEKQSAYLAPPVINPVQDATNSARITISGTALPDQTVKLYVNGKYINQTTVNDKNNFVFEKILLDEGGNDIKAKLISNDNKESDYSPNTHIVYKNKPPELNISSPSDKQVFTNTGSQIKVEGKTGADAQVTVNGYWAIVDNTGNFSYLLNLQKGENKIKITAGDNAGNQASQEITVTLNQ